MRRLIAAVSFVATLACGTAGALFHDTLPIVPMVIGTVIAIVTFAAALAAGRVSDDDGSMPDVGPGPTWMSRDRR